MNQQGKSEKVSSKVDAFTTSSEITICTASATLQGREIRAAMDKSFAGLYHDLDGGFTPLVCFSFLPRLGPTPKRQKLVLMMMGVELCFPKPTPAKL